jgi:hypothetical protein
MVVLDLATQESSADSDVSSKLMGKECTRTVFGPNLFLSHLYSVV